MMAVVVLVVVGTGGSSGTPGWGCEWLRGGTFVSYVKLSYFTWAGVGWMWEV